MPKLKTRGLNALNALFGLIHIELRKKMPDFVEQDGIRFRVTSEKTRRRAMRLLTKEPATIRWIEGFSHGQTFWDIGANIGTYTLYAARRGCRVLAFEPAYFNFAILNDNIQANGLSDRVAVYCVALNDRTELDALNLSSTESGSALHAFATTTSFTGETFQPVAQQGVLGMTLDDFAALHNAPHPHHIKIDVDGNEDKIVAGGRSTFADPALLSVMVELNTAWPEQVNKACTMLEAAGLTLDQQIPSNTQHVKNFFFVRSR